MKKLTILIVLLILVVNLMAQNCNLKTKIDAFYGDITRSSGYEVLCRSLNDGTLKMRVVQYIQQNDTTIVFSVLLEPMFMRCFSHDSELLIKSGETVITIPFSGDIDCGGRGSIIGSYAVPTPEAIDFLKVNPIDAIRIRFSEGRGDYTIRKTDYFIRTLKCFE